MKKYVILGYIYGIGGYQTYVANKLKLMSENGWDIYAISNWLSAMGGAMLPILERYKNNRITEFVFTYPGELSKRIRKAIVNTVADMIDYKGNEEEIIIEATTLNLFLWAEYIAKELHGRSICCEVNNRFYSKYDHPTLDFFRFKEQRGELMMMSKTLMHELFKGYIDYPEIDNHTVGALTQNEYEDNGIDYATQLQTKESDYVIGTVGWLDKGYYKVLIDEVVKFANKHPDKKVQFIVIGRSRNDDIEPVYESKAKSVPNLILNMMDSIAPVPSNLVELFDVSVASYGCAMITDKIGVKTILMHDPEDIPLGMLSYDITEPPIKTRINYDKTICDMLEDVLIKKIYDSVERTPYAAASVEDQKRVHLSRIHGLLKDIKYYDVEHIPNSTASLKHKVKMLFYRIFGLRISDKVFSIIQPH